MVDIVKVLLKSVNCYPVELLGRLIKENNLEVTLEQIESLRQKDKRPSEGDSQTICLMLFLELRKHGVSRDWRWVKGVNKKLKTGSVIHSWLQYKDVVVDPLPGFKFGSSIFIPGDILIMKRSEYILKTGFSVMSQRKEKLVMRWIEKNNRKYEE